MGGAPRALVLAAAMIAATPARAQEAPSGPKYGLLEVSCNAPGASLHLGGVPATTLPTGEPIKIPPGTHVVTVMAEGYVTASRPVTIEVGQHKTIKARLVKIPEDPCRGVTCSGHGTCIEAQGHARCECDEGFTPSMTWLECRPPDYLGPYIRNHAVSSMAFTALGITSGALIPVMFTQGLPEAGIAMSVIAWVTLSIGVPLGIETYAKYAKRTGLTESRGLVIGARTFGIVGFTAAGALYGTAVLTDITIQMSIASVVLMAVTAMGTGLAFKSLRAVKEDPVFNVAHSIVPTVAALPGGGSLGIAGCF